VLEHSPPGFATALMNRLINVIVFI